MAAYLSHVELLHNNWCKMLSRKYNKINHFLPQNNFLLGLNLTARNWWPLAARVKSSRASSRAVTSVSLSSFGAAIYTGVCDFFFARAELQVRLSEDKVRRRRRHEVALWLRFKTQSSELDFNIQSSLSPKSGVCYGEKKGTGAKGLMFSGRLLIPERYELPITSVARASERASGFN